jgi:hypothetical protein
MFVDRVAARERQPAVEVRLELLQDLLVERLHAGTVVSVHAAPPIRQSAGDRRGRRREQERQVEHLGPRDLRALDPLEQIVASDDLVQAARAHGREQPPHFLRHVGEVGDDLLRRPFELGPEIGPLGGDGVRPGRGGDPGPRGIQAQDPYLAAERVCAVAG